MKHDSTTCSDDRLWSLLQCEEETDESRLSALHVDQCPRCQLRLEELAAEPAEWRIVKHSLLHDNDENGRNHNVPSERPGVRARWQRHPTAWTDSMARQLLSSPSHPEMLGRIGRYEVERLIGVGGMGVVFKAFDTELNRPVAVKVLAPYLAGSGAARKRFAREARAAAAVVHEHVVAIHNVETDGESPFLVMPYVAGESLQQRIERDGALELCEILRVAMQTASGLAAAHAQGLVHRDVKPSNILLEQGIERTLLTDFGLARTSDDASLTHTGYHPGTPQYMSPEQARGDAVDARSDLFSLGSVVYTMCTGRPPFRAETNYGVLRRITDNEPRRIREVNPAIPEWLEGIVNKLLAKDISQRFQSADEVAELLEQCLAHVQQPTAVALPWDCRESFSGRARALRSWLARNSPEGLRPSAIWWHWVVDLVALSVMTSLVAIALQNMTAKREPKSDTKSAQFAPEGSRPSASFAWDAAESEISDFSRDLAPFETRSQQLWDTPPRSKRSNLMVRCHRFMLAQFLLMGLLLAGIVSRLPAQEPASVAVQAADRPQAEPGNLIALPEFAGKTTPTTELQAPGLEHLLNQLEAFRKSHTPFHIRHREVIKVRNASEAKAIESMGFAPGRLFDTEYESAFWDNRSWKRCLGHGVDGEQASEKHLGGDCAGTAGLIVPPPLLGVFLEPKPENCQLTFEGPLPRITFTTYERKDHFELWMLPVSGQWIPKRLRISAEAKDEPVLEWEVYHFKLFGEDRPPQIIDGEVRTTYRDGDKEMTITTEFVITKALYGDKVVPGDIDPSLAPMPAPAGAQEIDGFNGTLIETSPQVEQLQNVRNVLDKLKREGTAKRARIDAIGKPTDFWAAAYFHKDLSGEKVAALVDSLNKLGIKRVLFRTVDAAEPESSVTVHCPAEVSWGKVRTITEELEKHGEFKIDMRVAANDDPVKPVVSQPQFFPGDVAYFPSGPPTSAPEVAATGQTASEENIRILKLKNARAADAARIVEHLFVKNQTSFGGLFTNVAVDDRTNSVIVRGEGEALTEIEAILMRLDDASKGGDAPAGPSPEALQYQSGSLKGVQFRNDPNVFSFYLGTTGQSAGELRQQFNALEQHGRSLSEQLRKPLPDPATGEKLKSQLRDTVSQAFETRQKLQRAELTEFAKRLQGIQQSIELREKIRQQIIERRIQELLDPNIKWDSLDAGIDTTNLSPPTPPASVNSAMASAAPMRAVSAKTVKIQALLFDIDEKAEPFDLSKIQHDTPDQLEVFLKEAAAKGQVNILSRPQFITRLNQEAMLTIGQTVALTKNGDQVTSSRDVGVKIAITPREESGKPVLKVNFDFSRIDPESNADDPDATPFIQSNSGELTVRMNEYGGKGKLLGPFQAVPGKNRFLHLIVTLTDEVAVSLIPPEVQESWQFHEFAIVGDRKHSPIPEHFADELKERPPLVIDGE